MMTSEVASSLSAMCRSPLPSSQGSGGGVLIPAPIPIRTNHRLAFWAFCSFLPDPSQGLVLFVLQSRSLNDITCRQALVITFGLLAFVYPPLRALFFPKALRRCPPSLLRQGVHGGGEKGSQSCSTVIMSSRLILNHLHRGIIGTRILG